MTSRNWRWLLAFASMLLVGLFVAMQSMGKDADEWTSQVPTNAPSTIPSVGTLMLSPSTNSDSRISWEYKSVSYSDAQANMLGKDGWELVNVYYAGHAVGVFKRSVDSNAIQPTPVLPTVVQPHTSPNSTPFQATSAAPQTFPLVDERSILVQPPATSNGPSTRSAPTTSAEQISD